MYLLGKLVTQEKITPEEIEPSHEYYRFKPQGNILICGTPGTGKSNLCKVIVEEAILQGYPCLIVDYKGDLLELAVPYNMKDLPIGIDNKFVDEKFEKLHNIFGTLRNAKNYGQKLLPYFGNHNFDPYPEVMKKCFTVQQEGRIPLTIISLDFAEKEEEKLYWVKRLLQYLNKEYQGLPKTQKILLFDEAHALFQKIEKPASNTQKLKNENYELLRNFLRVVSREGKFIVIISTHSKHDFGFEFLRNGNFKHIFEFNQKYKALIETPSPTFQNSFISLGNRCGEVLYLIPRLSYSIKLEQRTPNERTKLIRFWDKAPIEEINLFQYYQDAKIVTLDEIGWKIISYLNSFPLQIEWNPLALTQKLGKAEKEVSKVLNSLEARLSQYPYRYRYFSWLDYNKLGYVTAFFIAKSKDGWQRRIDEIRSMVELVELHEVTPLSYLDEDLIFKFRFRFGNFRHYYETISQKILKFCQRGMSAEDRFKKYAEKMLIFVKEEISKHYKDVIMPLDELPEFPPEQIVSGCVCCETYQEYPGCYVFDNSFTFLSNDERRALRYLIHLENPSALFNRSETYHQLKLGHLLEEISRKLGVSQEEVRSRINYMIDQGVIRGAYLEIPWEVYGYKSAYILGHLDFAKDFTQQAKNIIRIYEVQEAHAIIGTYDILLKVRYLSQAHSPDFRRVLRVKQLLMPDYVEWSVKYPIKSGYRLTGKC